MKSSHTRIVLAIAVGVGLIAASGMPLLAQGKAKMDESVEQQLPKPFAKLSVSAQSVRDSAVAVAKQQLGVRYRLGASSPEKGFDCSGLVQFVMDHFNITLPRTSREQATTGKQLPREISALKPGDLLTFGKGKRIDHVGIYIGNGEFVHANTPGGQVKVQQLQPTRWWKGARRIIAPADTTAPKSVVQPTPAPKSTPKAS